MQFLASVSTPEEALIALNGGADIIDLKDPAEGPLGSVDPRVIEATIAAIGGRRPISAVAGNLPMEPDLVDAAVRERLDADFVKIGLFPADRASSEAVIAAAGTHGGKSLLIAVLFADRDPDFSLLPVLAKAGFSGVMLDTMTKGAGGLTQCLPAARLREFTTAARRHNLMVGLAGSLEMPDVQRLAVHRPDYLGFRGALTTGGRNDRIDLARVRELAGLIALANRRAPSLVEGPPAARPRPGPVEGDRIFVDDLTVPLEIGAYAHEHGRRQDVRFSVEAIVEPIPDDARSMADIYSYDVVIDAIRALAEGGHTVLVEELATRLAAELLADDRVRQVTVRVEKLGLGPGAVGVEIVRRRRGDGADFPSS